MQTAKANFADKYQAQNKCHMILEQAKINALKRKANKREHNIIEKLHGRVISGRKCSTSSSVIRAHCKQRHKS